LTAKTKRVSNSCCSPSFRNSWDS